MPEPGAKTEAASIDYITHDGIGMEDHALFEITKRCNYACKHCFTFGGQYNLPNELSAEEIISAARQFADLGFKDITFSGGDPATRPDLVEIVKGTKRIGITPHVFSTLLNEEQLNELKGYVGVFALSLDGPEAIHDAIRMHRGAYKDSIRLLELLKEKRLNYFVQSMVTPESIGHMGWLISTCADYGVKGVRLSHVSPIGRNLFNDGLYLSIEQIGSLWSKAQAPGGTNAPRIFTNLVEKNYFLENRASYTSLILHLLPDGDVVPMLGAAKSWRVGNLREEGLAQILSQKNPAVATFRKLLEMTYDQCEIRSRNWSMGWIPFEDALALNLIGPESRENSRIRGRASSRNSFPRKDWQVL